MGWVYCVHSGDPGTGGAAACPSGPRTGASTSIQGCTWWRSIGALSRAGIPSPRAQTVLSAGPGCAPSRQGHGDSGATRPGGGGRPRRPHASCPGCPHFRTTPPAWRTSVGARGGGTQETFAPARTRQGSGRAPRRRGLGGTITGSRFPSRWEDGVLKASELPFSRETTLLTPLFLYKP